MQRLDAITFWHGCIKVRPLPLLHRPMYELPLLVLPLLPLLLALLLLCCEQDAPKAQSRFWSLLL
jgi:hypothetical protein